MLSILMKSIFISFPRTKTLLRLACELPLTYRVQSVRPHRPDKYHRKLSASLPGCTESRYC